jgi:radical SAM superfamily enzyme YgiQ (UPF0313 family)
MHSQIVSTPEIFTDPSKPEVVLIFPKTIELEFISVDIPYAIFFVGSYLRKFGYPVKLFDQRKTSFRVMLKYIRDHNVRYVGVSTMTGPQLLFAEEISANIKDIDKGITVFWGGVHPTIAPDTCLELDCVDYVVRGEGEDNCVALLECLTENGDIGTVDGISWKDKDRRFVHNRDRKPMDLDKVSLDWDLIHGEEYILKRNGQPSLAFITSRGCHFRCQFCWDVIVFNQTFRFWSYPHLVKELDKLLKFNISYIEFLDDNIGSNKNHLFRLCEYLKEKNVQWFSSLRADFVTRPGVVQQLHNLHDCYMGVESGSQRMLDLIKKDQKVHEIIDAAYALKSIGVTGNYSWIVGLPGEEQEDMGKTLDLVDKIATIQPDAPQRLRVYSPYPGAPLYEKALEMGYKRPRNLYEWAKLSRENCELDYIVDKWELKTISYVSYFKFYLGCRAHQVKPIYYIPAMILKGIAELRWKSKFFKFPLEIYAVEIYRKLFTNPFKKLLYVLPKLKSFFTDPARAATHPSA